MKKWKYKYLDEIKSTWKYDEYFGRDVEHRTALHRPSWNAPIIYDIKNNCCYIYTDKSIDGLELVDSDVEVGK